MPKRRDVLRWSVAAGGTPLLSKAIAAPADPKAMLAYLCPPDGEKPELATASPPATPFVQALFVPPVKQPVERLVPPPDPRAHQLYNDYPPKKFYEIREQEFTWCYHPDKPYDKGSASWGFDGSTPGPTYHARYGEPVLVRRYNDLPPVGVSKVNFALPSTTTHLHNGHTASESDGQPQDWIDSGEFWDHHYGNFPARGNEREKLTTLWYHDHRMDFTAANVYAGLDGFYLLFDDEDTGDENDPGPRAWRLPSGKYDVPLIFHDILFDENGQVRWNPFNTDGILGDRYTVNRKIQPYFEVEARKYRFRLLNGGPSRFYRMALSSGEPFCVLTGDGNVLPEPIDADQVYLSVAQRVDVVIDFSHHKPGERIHLVNNLEQSSGKGPSGRTLDPPVPILEFRVSKAVGRDPSSIPKRLRPLPEVDLSIVKQERVWEFDYDGGLWTVNGKVFEPNRIDAGVERGTAEIWTIRNGGNSWSHPVHCHFTEFIILEVNGRKILPTTVQDNVDGRYVFLESLDPKVRLSTKTGRPHIQTFMGGQRRDVATLLPGDEIKVYIRFSDFLGKYVMHCHNVVHEDHAMMVRWDIVVPGKGFVGSRSAKRVYGTPPAPPHLEPRPANGTQQQDQSAEEP